MNERREVVWPGELARSAVGSEVGVRTGGVVLRLAAALALGAGAAGCGVALLATSGWLISRAAEHPPVLFLMVAIVAVRAFGLGRAVLTYAERLLGHDAAFAVLGRLRSSVYARLADRGAAWLTRSRAADLGSRLVDDVDAVLDLLLRAVLPAATALLVAGGGVVAVGVLLPEAGWLLALAVAIVVGLVPPVVALSSGRASAAIPPRQADLAVAATELFHGMPDLLAHGGADLTVVGDLDRRLRRAETRAAWVTALGNAAVIAVTGLACCGALALGTVAVREGRLPGTSLAVVTLVPLGLVDVLGTLPDAVRHGLRAAASLRRVRSVLAEAAAPWPSEETPASRPYDLVVEDLTVRWPGVARAVLDRFSLTVSEGSRVAVVGGSGAGKSTLAGAILGQLQPETGNVRIGKVSVAAGGVQVTNRLVGLCAQDAYLFDSTIAENVRLAKPAATDDEIRAALASARLGEWVAELPDDIETRVGEHGRKVSGGQRQRIALARVLLADPPVVVLDEPAEHLDEPTAVALLRDLLTATAGRTVLLLTHRFADLRYVDHVHHLPEPAPAEPAPR